LRKAFPYLVFIIIIAVFVMFYIKKPEAPVAPKAPEEEVLPEIKLPPPEIEELMNQAAIEAGRNDLLAARETYQKLKNSYPESEAALEAHKKIDDLNIRILFSQIITEDSFLYLVQPGDTLGWIAKENNTTIEFLQLSNNLSGDLIKVGQKLKVYKGELSILVDKSQYTLALLSAGKVLKTYRVAVGAGNLTPNGEFTIINKLPDPVWYTAGAIVSPDSPKNILGSRWLGIDEVGYGIHGTTMPESIGQSATQGCVRMINAEVEELYSIVPVGTKVTIKE